jgi:hypothetical protein
MLFRDTRIRSQRISQNLGKVWERYPLKSVNFDACARGKAQSGQ